MCISVIKQKLYNIKNKKLIFQKYVTIKCNKEAHSIILINNDYSLLNYKYRFDTATHSNY